MFSARRMEVSSLGPLCEEIGLYSEMLALESLALMPTVDQVKITKGVVLELSQFRRSNKFSWNEFHSWMKQYIQHQPCHPY